MFTVFRNSAIRHTNIFMFHSTGWILTTHQLVENLSPDLMIEQLVPLDFIITLSFYLLTELELYVLTISHL